MNLSIFNDFCTWWPLWWILPFLLGLALGAALWRKYLTRVEELESTLNRYKSTIADLESDVNTSKRKLVEKDVEIQTIKKSAKKKVDGLNALLYNERKAKAELTKAAQIKAAQTKANQTKAGIAKPVVKPKLNPIAPKAKTNVVTPTPPISTISKVKPPITTSSKNIAPIPTPNPTPTPKKTITTTTTTSTQQKPATQSGFTPPPNASKPPVIEVKKEKTQTTKEVTVEVNRDDDTVIEKITKTVTTTAIPAASAVALGARSAFATLPDTNLQIIEGIGPKMEALLKDNGIKNWRDLTGKSKKNLRKMLVDYGSKYAIIDPSSWPKQAFMAMNNDWEALIKFQKSDGSESKLEKLLNKK